MRKLLLYLTILIGSGNLFAQTITKQSGWLESAFVEWTPVTGADSYNVYYTGGGKTNQQIDNQLIRSYGSYFRADVLGLAAGQYMLTIKPVTAGIEGAGTTTSSLTVLAHDRNGFAFDNGGLPGKRIPGGYKEDGTPKTGAVILYITRYSKNKISMNITGASANPCIGLQNILYAIKKGKDTRPFIIRLIGNITDMAVMEGGDITIENAQNPNSYLTLEGVGNDAVVNGMGVRLKSASNIEVRNLGFMNCNSTAGDNIGMQQDNDHIWIHNNDSFYGNAGSAGDQVKGDGALDNKNSTFCTFSYNHFWDNGKCSLLGLSENTTTGLYVTYHHNWFDHSDSRHPRVRFYSAHIYNNYYDGNAKYGTGSTEGSSLFVEGNYFRNTKHPMMISMQGTDVFDDGISQWNDSANMGTFSDETGGIIKAFNNTFDADNGTNNMRFVAYGDPNPKYNDIPTKPKTGVATPPLHSSTIDFDAYVVSNRGDQVPNTVTSFSGGNTYNNFDTDASLYVKNLVIDSPADAKTKVMQYAGRVQGGDLKWTFIPADDTDDISIPALKATLTNYTSNMVAVQGEVVPPGNQTLTATSNNNNQSVPKTYGINKIVFTWGGDATNADVTFTTVTGITNTIIVTKDVNAKTLTLSGVPAETTDYIISTSGELGDPAYDSGTITVLPPSSQVLTVTSNNNQSITIGATITPIVFTWSGDATDANITGLPAGLSATKDPIAKTITITGTPTATGTTTFTATTSGSTGTSVSVSGTITVNTAASGSEIHNFSTATPLPTSSTFYTISGNMNNSTSTPPATITYNGISLTKCLKMESSTTITFTITGAATLVFVMDPNLYGTSKTYIAPSSINWSTATSTEKAVYSYTAANGITSVSLPSAGTYIIRKRDQGDIYYMKTSYSSNLGLDYNNIEASKVTLYPNPVTNQLNIAAGDQKVESVMIYSLTGNIVKSISKEVESVDMSGLASGNYLVKVTTDQGSVTKKIVKK